MSTWVFLLKGLSFLARLGAFAASVIVAGLLAALLVEKPTWISHLVIYIECIAGISIITSLIPPYPNFIYDGFFAVCWLLSAGFSLLVMFLESDCYGVVVSSDGSAQTVSCPKYKAIVAFCFLGFLAWLAVAGFGFLLLLTAILYNSHLRTKRHFNDPSTSKSSKLREKSPATLDEEVNKTEAVRNHRPPMRVEGILADSILRYWVCYGIIGITLVAILVPLLFVYAVPAFALYVANNVDVPENANVTMTNLNNDTLTFDAWSPIKVPWGVYPRLDPMNVSFFLPDTQPNIIPFATVALPALSFKPGEYLQLKNQTLKLGDINQFADVFEQFAFSNEMTIAGRAVTTLRVGPFHTKVTLDKEKSFGGLSNFTGVNIEYLRIDPTDNNAVAAAVEVPNPAPASVDFPGSATANILIGDVVIGTATVNTLHVVPGNNSIAATGQIDVQNVAAHVGDLVATELPYLEKGLVIASVQGSSLAYNGVALPYWTKAFQAIKLTATAPIGPVLSSLLEDVLGLSGGSFLSTNANGSVSLNTSALIGIVNGIEPMPTSAVRI